MDTTAPVQLSSMILWRGNVADNNNKAKRDAKHSVGAPASALSEARTQVVTSNAVSLQFSRLATNTAHLVGHPYTFFVAVVLLVVWAATGPLFHFSDTWQLIINTSTTIITFLVVFLIQNTQNRDAKAIHLKLDELIRSHVPARNEMIDIEKLSDEELEELRERYAALCEQRRAKRAKAA